MDINTGLLKRNIEFYGEERQLSTSHFFVVAYKLTKTRFVVRKTDLMNCKDLSIYENESYLSNLLKHKNLLPFLTSFVVETHLWTIMPFAELGSLGDLCLPFGISEDAISCVMRDVLNAVQYLHTNCIIHHSIRSSHILVYGSPKTEFRFVLTGLKYSINTIREGEIVYPVFDYPVRAERILNWLAPEVLEQNLQGYCNKADIYSVGITCCELCNGATPYAGLEASEVLLYKLNGEVPEPLDSESKHLKQFVEFDNKELLEDERNSRKYVSYNKKTFSKHFKQFVVECCLHPEPETRSNAKELLSHPFVEKSEKVDKTRTLMESIAGNDLPQDIRQLVDNYRSQR